MKDPVDILKAYWGHDSFRPLQLEIIQSVLDGNDTLALLPTGGGKSICFQVPALCMEGICIVVSPLIALMLDQVQRLKEMNIPAIAITSSMSKREIDVAFDNCVYGKTKFLYLSPERLTTEIARVRISRMDVSFIAVDEAHCISQWGYDFRPPYLDVAEIREILPGKPVLALTATATPKVAEDIQVKLLFTKKSKVFLQSFARHNIAYIVRKTDDKNGQLFRLAERVPASGIVYVRNRRKTQEIALLLQASGISSTFYHAGLNAQERQKRQMEWLQNKARVMVATNAFGMGIDKPDVRFVVHMDLPDSPEAYFQEAGRAGRDGEESGAIMLWNDADIANLEQQVRQSFPELKDIRKCWQAVSNFYQLPVNTSEGQTFIFDLKKIASTYNLDQLQIYNSMKIIEREGYIVLSDAILQPSRVHIRVGNEDLYRYEVQNLADETLIKAMLRMYGGMFETYVRISEMDLARRAGKSAEVVAKDLQRFDQLGLISYIPRTDQPMMTLLKPRPDAYSLYISPENLIERKKTAEHRVQAMISFVKDAQSCRQVLLLRFFGEKETPPCGKCDNCKRLAAEGKKKERLNLEDEILSVLKVEQKDVRELVAMFPLELHAEVNTAMRKLLDREVIGFDKNRKLKIK
ncbi:MAG TPA: ATP-dependent DNA helicase RecQ [Bacteroidia bacterium]|nr:ATP-dependent DNA helicase RecQ [Bacteroidia bacterium]